ncbi:MAG: DUF4294 domain-containing protein [Candidatus Limisoma sp.]
MKHLLGILFLLVAFGAHGQNADELSLPSVHNKVYKGYYFFHTDEDGDSTLMLVLNPITCFPPERFKNKKAEEFYWRTVRDVKKALPYAKLISATLIETYEYIETLPTKKEREAHMKRMEDELFRQYKPELKRFSRRQAKVLVKLIYRETNQPSYNIIKAFLGSFRATVWQGFGKIFGVSLKADWRPESDDNDAMLERIATRIEQGAL